MATKRLKRMWTDLCSSLSYISTIDPVLSEYTLLSAADAYEVTYYRHNINSGIVSSQDLKELFFKRLLDKHTA